jgi:CBS domain-containing protein
MSTQKVEDVMDRVVDGAVTICYPDSTVGEAFKLMQDAGTGYCCVVSRSSGELCGIITRTDLLPKMSPVPHTQGTVNYYIFFGVKFSVDTPMDQMYSGVKDKPVAAGMTTKVITLNPSDDSLLILKIISKHQVRRIPVLNEKKALVGIVTSKSLPLPYLL